MHSQQCWRLALLTLTLLIEWTHIPSLAKYSLTGFVTQQFVLRFLAPEHLCVLLGLIILEALILGNSIKQ